MINIIMINLTMPFELSDIGHLAIFYTMTKIIQKSFNIHDFKISNLHCNITPKIH